MLTILMLHKFALMANGMCEVIKGAVALEN